MANNVSAPFQAGTTFETVQNQDGSHRPVHASPDVVARLGQMLTISGSVTATLSGTPTVQLANGATLSINNFPATQPVSVATLPLPSGASTLAAQTTGNTTLGSILTALGNLATSAKQDAAFTTFGTLATDARLESVRALLAGVLAFARPPLTYTAAAGFPKALTSSWTKAVTTTSATKGLRIAPIAGATAYDIEWTVVATGAGIPGDQYGEAIQGGEDFAAGLPIGDIYLRSATGQIANVKTGL